MTFYFYDLETSGVKPKTDRILQFAGQRTDMDLNPIGEPDDLYIALTRDILPNPEATLLTGITPQMTMIDGLSEAEFLRYFTESIALPDTIFIGFNSIRFDDEFLRYLHWRNYYDPYIWQWKDGRGKWDLLDVVRMMRALRPDGMKWPVDADGKVSNRLELLTRENNILHDNAHTALSDVKACIGLAKLIKEAQPKLYDYLFGLRTKQAIQKLVLSGEPFVYTSGHFESQYEKTTTATLALDMGEGCVLVCDLRYNPLDWADKSDDELVEAMAFRAETPEARLPFKKLQFNRCPALAPLGVLDDDSKRRIGIDLKLVSEHAKALKSPAGKELAKRVKGLIDSKKLDWLRLQADNIEPDPCEQLYEGFIERGDEGTMAMVRAAKGIELQTLAPEFHDQRLQSMYPLYKGRNYPKFMTEGERVIWEDYINKKLFAGGQESRFMHFVAQIDQMAKAENLAADKKYLLDELRLYAESIAPA